MAMDNFSKLLFTLFLLSTGMADPDLNGPECPSNTVEIVFTKNGVICATTSSVPELNHLSVDPNRLPDLLGKPPIAQRLSQQVLTHPLMNTSPPPPQHMIIQQMPVPHMGSEFVMLGQPIPSQQLLAQPSMEEFMSRRMPLYHENIINQNMDYIDRRPDLMEDKRLYYQKMLWEKLRRDSFIKKLVKTNPNQLFGVQYIDNNDMNPLPEKTTEEQPHNSQQNIENIQKTEENIEINRETAPEQTPEVAQGFDEQTNNNNNDYNDNQSQEPIGLEENSNSKEQILKQYLNYLNKDDSPIQETKTELHRDRQQTKDSEETISGVPDIITGYMPEPPIETNAHTFGMKIPKKEKTPDYSVDEPMESESQVSYQFERPDINEYNHNLMKALRSPQKDDSDQSLRLVSTGMTFGHRVHPQDKAHKSFGYGFKSYPEYNDEKSRKFRAKSKYLAKPSIEVRMPIDGDVVLVTADPNQREIIETLEAKQLNSRRNERKFSDDWSNGQSPKQNNAINFQKNRDFRLDETRIEYNGWKPLRLQQKASEQSEDTPQKEGIMKSSSSERVISILPIIGRANNKWSAIYN